MFKGVAWEQVSGLVQRLLMFGAGIAVAKGWISEVAAAQIVGGIIAFAGVLWGIKVNTSASLVASVDGLEQVQGVVTKPTIEGRELAKSIPSATVVPAGTPAAASVAAATH